MSLIQFAITLSFLCFSILLNAQEHTDASRHSSYYIPENEDFILMTQTNSGTLEYTDNALKRTDEVTSYEIRHLRQTKITDSEYIVWNFLPVGIGHYFQKNQQGETFAEWKLNYTPNEEYLLSPNFTGKKKSFLTSFLGNEFIVSYGYHYQEDPAPSFWDVSLKYNMFLVPIEKWRLGAYTEFKKYFKGCFSRSDSQKPFQFDNIYTAGLWTDLELKKDIVFQLESTLNFMNQPNDVYLAKYGLSISVGHYF